MTPDPAAHGPLTNPRVAINILLGQAAYASDRVIQGDWSERYANKLLRQQSEECTAVLRSLGSNGPYAYVYAGISAGGRALVRWEYLEGQEVIKGTQYAKGLTA